MRSVGLLATLLAIARVRASETVFSVHDDVLAFPQVCTLSANPWVVTDDSQYDITFSESYITLENARKRLKNADSQEKPIDTWEGDVESQLARFNAKDDTNTENDDDDLDQNEYISMTLHGAPYLCAIPMASKIPDNTTQPEKEDQLETDLTSAADRGWRLLQDMDGKPCLYYSTGWWSYSFCYNGDVTQFHALPFGANGGRLWPPIEDPNTPSYVLGKYKSKSVDGKANSEESSPSQEVGELQTKADASYLVQHLGSGTACDLTGKPRKVEVQFHCHLQSTDRIGWIKETATCAYMMVIYTPRLCNDVAFLPPKATHVHRITCQEVLRPDQIAEWETRKSEEATRKMIGQGASEKPKVVVGNIEVGGQKLVGGEGHKIERGRIVLTAEERAEIVVMQKDGQIQGLSKAELEKLDINPEVIATFQKELQKLAGNKDWKIERIDDANGQIQIRGIVANDEGKKLPGKVESASDNPPEGGDDGSEEEYKEEI